MNVYELSNELGKIQKNINTRDHIYSDPRALAIAKFAREKKQFTCKEIAFTLNIPIQSVYYHVKKMRSLGIVKKLQHPIATQYIHESADKYKETEDVDRAIDIVLGCIAAHGFARWTNFATAAEQLGINLNALLYAIKYLHAKDFISIQPDEYYLEIKLQKRIEKIEEFASTRKKFNTFAELLISAGFSRLDDAYVRSYMKCRSIRVFCAKNKIFIERYIPETFS